MEGLTRKSASKKSWYGSKAYTRTLEVGKWYKFETCSGGIIGYGKVVEVEDDGIICKVEKYFELPNYKPYAAPKWYDNLPFAVYENKDEEEQYAFEEQEDEE